MTALDALIEELQKATEGSRELDFKIAHALWPGENSEDGKPTTRVWAQAYTTELHWAVEELVPAKRDWQVSWDEVGAQACASIENPDDPQYDFETWAATPALTMCISALKARAAADASATATAQKSAPRPT